MSDNADYIKNIRKNILISAFKAGSNGAHLAPSLSCVEIFSALYKNILKFDKKNPFSDERDYFILSKGHAGLALYATLYEFGLISENDFASFEQNGGDFPGQPSKNVAKRIEFSGGSLGMGLSYAIGLVLGGKRVFTVVGDGECNEGIIWEAATFAGHNKLKNLTVIVDYNGMQADGDSKDILSYNVEQMWKACGWDVYSCNGHDVEDLTKALRQEHDKPLVVLAHTVKGKGVSFMENVKEWHHGRLSQEQLNQALKEIEEKNYGN